MIENPSIRIYDSSGPYTDSNATIDLKAGLPELRKSWIQSRGNYVESNPSYNRLMANRTKPQGLCASACSVA